MKDDANPRGDGNTAQAPGSEKRDLASKEKLLSIRDLMQSIGKEREHEIIVQCILVLRLQEICLQGSGSYKGSS
jgi:hypothetical protein